MQSKMIQKKLSDTFNFSSRLRPCTSPATKRVLYRGALVGHHGTHGHAGPRHAVDPVRVVVHARVHAREVGEGALVAVGHHALDGPLARRAALAHERSARIALAGVATAEIGRAHV